MKAGRIREYIMIGKGASFGKQYISRDVPSYPLCLMFMVYFRMITVAAKGMGIIDIIAESIFGIIYLIIWISQLIHPLRMMRMYYLCPKDRAEREADIRDIF